MSRPKETQNNNVFEVLEENQAGEIQNHDAVHVEMEMGRGDPSISNG